MPKQFRKTNYMTELARVSDDYFKLIKYLMDKEALISSRSCCQQPMELKQYTNKVVWRCINGECRKKVSALEGSLFSGTKLPLETLAQLVLLWAIEVKQENVATLLKITSKSVRAYYAQLREVCVR